MGAVSDLPRPSCILAVAVLPPLSRYLRLTAIRGPISRCSIRRSYQGVDIPAIHADLDILDHLARAMSPVDFPVCLVLPVAEPIQVAFLSLDAKKASCGARDLHGSLLARFAGQCLASEPPWAAQASNSPAS